jgi:hypothetical protein
MRRSLGCVIRMVIAQWCPCHVIEPTGSWPRGVPSYTLLDVRRGKFAAVQYLILVMDAHEKVSDSGW